MRALLRWFDRWSEKVEIMDYCTQTVYLSRWWLYGNRTSPVALMLHKFHRSDYDRHLHDHPWPFWSLILKGGYWEKTGNYADDSRFIWSKLWYGPGSFLRRPAEWRHAVILPPGKTCWTLVLRFRKTRGWGFNTQKGWIYYRDYFSNSEFKGGCE